MKGWTAGAGRFWTKAVPSLVVLFVVRTCCHVHIVSPRIYWSDYLIAAPVILCGVISIRAGKEVDFWTRLSFGLLQAIVLIMIYSNHWARDIRFGNPDEVFTGWAVLTGVYAVIFGGVTQVLSAQTTGRQRDPM